jgi:hypothetical protein
MLQHMAAVTALCSDVLHLLLTVMGTVEHASHGQMDSTFQRYVQYSQGITVTVRGQLRISAITRLSFRRLFPMRICHSPRFSYPTLLDFSSQRCPDPIVSSSPADLHAGTPTPPMNVLPRARDPSQTVRRYRRLPWRFAQWGRALCTLYTVLGRPAGAAARRNIKSSSAVLSGRD